MKCPVCDDEIQPGALFCSNCGTRVTQQSGAGTPTVATYAPDAPPLSQPYDYREPLAPAAPQWSAPGQFAYPSASPPNSTAAIVSLVFGILSWVVLPVIGAIVAIVAGHMARNEIRNSNGQLGGGGMATAGLILGYLHVALLVLGICAVIALFAVGSQVR